MQHAARIRRQHAGKAFEQRRLSGPVRSDEAKYFARAHREPDAVQRGDSAEALGNAFDADKWFEWIGTTRLRQRQRRNLSLWRCYYQQS